MSANVTDSVAPEGGFPIDATVDLESILCTDELLVRPARLADCEQESRAFVAIAKALADSTSDILQILAETVLALTQCDSSGLSLLTNEDGRGELFYHPAIAGAWKQHRGGRNPRSCDPSGDVLDRDCAQLFRRFERRYTAFQPILPSGEECLIVPFYVDGEAIGTIWAVMHTDRHRFDAQDERVITALAQFASVALKVRSIDSLGIRAKPHPLEQDFRLLADSIPSLVYTATLTGEIEFVSRQTLAHFGRTADGLTDWGQLIYPEDRPAALNSWRQSLETGNPWESEHRLSGADGAYRWFQHRAVLRTDANGCRIRWYVLLTEIDEQKKIEERLRESEMLLIEAQRLSHTGSWKHDFSSGVVTITPEMARIYAIEGHELATTVEFFVSRIHPTDRPGVEAKYAQALLEKCDFAADFRIVLGDGSIRYIHNTAHPKVNETGVVVEFTGTVLDATEQVLSREELRRTINTIPTLSWSTRPDGYVEFLNQRWLEFTGLSAEQAEGFGWSVAIHPEDAKGLVDYWQAALAKGAPVDTEARLRRCDGTYRWFLFRAEPLRNESGQILKWYGTNVDIEDRRRAEDEVRQNERNLRTIINTLPWLSWSARPDGYGDFLSQRYLDFTGLTSREIEGSGWAAVIHPEDLEGLSQHWQAALENGTSVDTEARMRRFDGVYRWFLFRADPFRDESGQILKWYGTNVDIEDRKRAEEAVRHNEQNLRAIINTIPTLSWSTRPDGYVEFLSQRWLDFTGLSAEQGEGFGWTVAIHPDDAARLGEYWQAALASGTHVDVEARLRRFDGVYRWLLFRADPLRDEFGQIAKWYGTNLDIEDRKRAEDEVRGNEQKLRAIINTIPTLSWSTRPDGYVEFLSQRWLDFTGLSAEQAEGFGWTVTIHPDDAPRLGAYWQAALASGTHVDVEARLRRFDGVYRWLLFRADPLRDESGQIVKWYGTNFDIEDRKLAEEALRANEQNLRLVFDTIPALVCTMSARGELELVNHQTYDYFGISLDELKNWSLIGAVHPDDLDKVVARWRYSVETGEPYSIEHRIRRADGLFRWFHVSGLPLRDSNDQIVRWYVLLVDSEERRRIEEALRTSELNLRQLTETIPEMLWSATSEGEIDYCNTRFFNYTGFSNEAVMKQGWRKTIHPEDADRVGPIWSACVATGSPYQVEVRTFHAADGTYRWCAVSALPLRDENGRTLKWHGTIVDTHDAKLAREKLRHSEAFLEEAQRLSHTGSIGSDLSIDERYWSDETRRIFEFDTSTRITTPMLLERVHPQDMALVKKNMQLAYTGKEFQFEARLLMRDGALKYIRVVGHGARALGFRLDFIGAIQDVTQQRLAEEALTKVRSELAHVSRITSLGTLTASIAHEVNQPLAAVIASADSCTAWLAAVPPNLDKARAAADRVIRAATQASEVVQRIRTMIQKTSPAVMTVLQVNEIVEEAISLIRTELMSRRVLLSTDLAEHLPPVFGDRVQIAQVVINLAMNGMEAMAETDDVERSLAIKTTVEGHGKILVSVADTGPGLDPSVTQELFDPFFTTKATGMGMGLSISRSIIEAHAGRLWAAANEPRGAVFHFTLPSKAAND